MRLSTRKGFALPIALGSMIVIGMILAGVFFAATQENRAGRNTL
jgi:Tfp pilus assembly protein PilX